MYIPELVYIVHMWPVGPILDVQHVRTPFSIAIINHAVQLLAYPLQNNVKRRTFNE